MRKPLRAQYDVISNPGRFASDCHLPDGIVVDAKAGHIYWTNMGVPNLDDGSIERADLDGGNRSKPATTICYQTGVTVGAGRDECRMRPRGLPPTQP